MTQTLRIWESLIVASIKNIQRTYLIYLANLFPSKGLAIVTGLKYPSRTAIQMLNDLYPPYSQQFGLQAKSATNNSLTKKSKNILSEYCEKFDDANKVDKASALNAKVDEVKVQMQDNIAAMLKNTEQAESLAERSNQLNEQANVFQKKSKDLRKQMRCKNIKMTIILVSLVVGVLVIILVPLIIRAKKAATGGRMLRGFDWANSVFVIDSICIHD